MGPAGCGHLMASLLSVPGSRGRLGVGDKRSAPGSLGIAEISEEHLGVGWGARSRWGREAFNGHVTSLIAVTCGFIPSTQRGFRPSHSEHQPS